MAIKTSETYYVTQSGAGADYSVAQFNALSGDYSDDTFYFSGTITAIVDVDISGTSGGGYVTLDGYQAGDCDPINSECSSSAELTNSDSSFYFTTQESILEYFNKTKY